MRGLRQKRLREQGIHPVDFEPIDESESTNVAIRAVRSRHESGLSRRRVHERGRETHKITATWKR